MLIKNKLLFEYSKPGIISVKIECTVHCPVEST